MAPEAAMPVLSPERDAEIVANYVREGRFQCSLSLVTAVSSLISGLEVAYEHYRGSYSRRVMYTPVILSAVLCAAGVAAIFRRKAAHTFMRATSLITLVDAGVGFYFHVRGIQRKPGGWRIPMTNMIMGPPVFAPLLFGTAAYLGLIASYLQREDEHNDDRDFFDTVLAHFLPARERRGLISEEQDIREGRFQKQVAIVTAISALLSGFEAYYSHYKNNFRYWIQWTPIMLAPLLAGVALASIRSRRMARTTLPVVSAACSADAAIGFYFHVRGVIRRPGGLKHWLYNIIYGPPIFAPLLFGAAGMMGLLASMLRRSSNESS